MALRFQVKAICGGPDSFFPMMGVCITTSRQIPSVFGYFLVQDTLYLCLFRVQLLTSAALSVSGQ